MTNGESAKQSRATITVGLSNVPDEKVLQVKQAIESLTDDIPDAIIDVRMGTANSAPPRTALPKP